MLFNRRWPMDYRSRREPRWDALLRIVACMVAVAFVMSCGGASVVETTTNAATPPTDTTTHTGTIQRAILSVQVSIDPNDAALASTLGLGVGGLTVTLQHVGSADAIRTAPTNSSGVTTFDNLLEGQYTVAVDRFLTASERARLSPSDGDIALLAAGTSVNVVAPSRGAIMQLVASRRGSLVLSEFYNYTPIIANASYPWSNYFEVYNNSDTTIYLDGMLVFRDGIHAQWPIDPCATVNAAVRLDPNGIWASAIWAFPGTGHEHPLSPGQAAVVATDALDHRTSGGVDLTLAQFEMIGSSADANNPASLDMVRLVGTEGALGRGENLLSGRVYGLALPVASDTSQLPNSTITSDGTTSVVHLIPRAAIVDAVGMDAPQAIWEGQGSYRAGLRPCENPWTLPQWDRDRSRLLHPLEPQAVRRRSVGRTVDGREILQSTGTGSRDFELGVPLQRSLDKPKN